MAARKRRKSQPRKVSAMLETVLGDLGLESAVAAFRIGEVWAEAVGEKIAAHASPVGMRNGVLEVSVDSSVWCQQLQFEKQRVLGELEIRMGLEAPRDIRFRVA